MSQENGMSVRNIRKNSVYKAIDLLRTKTAENQRGQDATDKRCCKIRSHCTSVLGWRGRKKVQVTPFSKSLIMTEMRSYIVRQDWRHAENLFPLLLNYPKELEPLIWRCALVILLYSPRSSSLNLQEFLEMCIGTQGGDISQILERLLVLQDQVT